MHRQYFFGYGSLVNHRTHSYPDARRARLEGWRRTWCHTQLRDEAFLSVHPADGAVIHGLVAAVPQQDWRALDLRESGYDRHAVTTGITHDLSAPAEVHVYAIPDRHRRVGEGGHILMSYLDVVVQGFLHHYGPAGVAHFFDTTDGWAVRVLDDRGAPRYPRHQILSAEEKDIVDRHLAQVPAEVVEKID
ncbi:MAG: gamma-glutamylcyclotransferase [Rhodobacteraceae bacterium]|nr:gamma-glutamylcyclotransferase [Paracoccaceae bacterium]